MSGELVYLVHPDAALVDRLGDALHRAGFKVLSMSSEAEAEEVAGSFRHLLPDVLVTPLGDPSSDDSILFKLLVANPLMEQVPVVLLASSDARARREALRLGLTNMVLPPYDDEEVVLTTRLALEQRRDENRLFGSLAQLPVADLLQMAEVGRRTGMIRLRRGGRSGTLWLEEGIIVHGELDDGSEGEEAITAMVLWERGTFEADFSARPPERRISVRPSALLLEAMRRLDESRRGETAAAGPGGTAAPRAVPAARPAAAPRPASEETDREAELIHLALQLLNLLALEARTSLAPVLLHRRLESARRAAAARHPELRIFQVSREGIVALAYDVTVVLTAEGLVQGLAAWLAELVGPLRRTVPASFTPERLAALLEPLGGRLEEAGLGDALRAALEGVAP